MKTVFKKVLRTVILFMICLPIIATSFTRNNVFAADENNSLVNYVEDYDYVSFENVDGFKNYLLHENIDIYDVIDITYLADNFELLYSDALHKGYIRELTNDVLLYEGNTNSFIYMEDENGEIIGSRPRWNAGKTLDEANSGTHQVITRDAVNSIANIFPNFFNKYNNVYICQLYSDYPDMYEDNYFNSWHFYNYNTKSNYWDGIFDDANAKTKFFEHYNNAIAYYYTNRTQSFRELGCAIHYLCDIATPVHTGDGIENSDLWVGVLAVLSPGVAAGIYLGTMISNHITFESYVDERDENSECNIPTNINYDYYVNTSINTIIEDLAEYSYGYYDEATGNDSNKNIAMVNTIPKAKEVTAGILYRFAK